VMVLVVDDEPLARHRLTRMLAKIESVEAVAEAENGRRALEQILEFQPDVVLLDIRMPGIDGIQVARSAARELSIIFTTAYDEHAVEAFETGAIDYLL
jgi:two-component system response regulator AlgR